MIALGSDHAGYRLKQEIIKYLDSHGFDWKDYGTFSEESCDYPVYAQAVARAILDGDCDRGLLFCGTGVGIAMAANKVPGIRAASCSDVFSAEMCRRHNNAQILALGGRVVGTGLAEKLVEVFLAAEFEGGRHARRVEMIDGIK
ncbi:MAG: ribose 5-phosphate isomerase B [Clostridiales bacterium]|jgi:ribose 5-phosphate isomerase B|nr:ribose 5-phosphate isomerase B [Clostridiales bacterium]